MFPVKIAVRLCAYLTVCECVNLALTKREGQETYGKNWGSLEKSGAAPQLSQRGVLKRMTHVSNDFTRLSGDIEVKMVVCELYKLNNAMCCHYKPK